MIENCRGIQSKLESPQLFVFQQNALYTSVQLLLNINRTKDTAGKDDYGLAGFGVLPENREKQFLQDRLRADFNASIPSSRLLTKPQLKSTERIKIVRHLQFVQHRG